MNSAQIKAVAYPDTDHVETPNGRIGFSFVRRDSVLVACGKDVGWFHLDGAAYYGAVRYGLKDGAWTVTEACVRTVTSPDSPGSRAGDDAPREQGDAVQALFDQAFRAWIADRTDIAAQVDLCNANHALFSGREKVDNLERQLANARAALPKLEAARASARSEVRKAKAARQKAVKAATTA